MNILKLLEGGDLRSIGKVKKVVQKVLKQPEFFAELFWGFTNESPLIRMRAADAIEKITEKHPSYLSPYKKELLEEVIKIEQQEVRWHLALLLPRLVLTSTEKKKMYALLNKWFTTEKKSIIVRVNALQGMAELAKDEADLRKQLESILKNARKDTSAAVRSRAKKLQQQF